MAEDPQPDWLSCLPSAWTYGVTRDGRFFFINEEAQSTSWLHPVLTEAVTTGHRKTPDLPCGWEEGYTFEGARCFINHNEQKVTCKHPVSGVPSQDNCIFVVNEQPAPKASSEQDHSGDKKERPVSTMSETSNYTGGSDYSTFPNSPAITNTAPVTTTSTTSSTRPSRSFKKVHNFGKRSNSIKRNPNAPVVKSNWLHKQDSAGMKLWKKRWFVLSDMCLYYYRDEKEDSILGSILLPSFHISMLSVDDRISRKYAFKATHPNMRTYYFCTDTAKEMESWMKVMTDAALVHSEPSRRNDKLNVDQRTPQELNNLLNHRTLTRPEIQNNQRNREPARQHSLSRADDKWHKDSEKNKLQREREYYTLQRDSQRRDGLSYTLPMDGEKYLMRKDGEKYSLPKDAETCSSHRGPEKYTVQNLGEKYSVQNAGEKYTVQNVGEKYSVQNVGEKYTIQNAGEKYMVQNVGEKYTVQTTGEKYSVQNAGEKYTVQNTGENYSVQNAGEKYAVQNAGEKYSVQNAGEKYSVQNAGEKYSVQNAGEKYSVQNAGEKYSVVTLEKKYAPAKEGDKYLITKDGEKYSLQKVGDRHTLRKDGQKFVPQKNVKRQLSLKETERYSTIREGGSKYGTLYGTLREGGSKYGTLQVVDKYGSLREGKKYGTLREGDKFAILRYAEKYATIRGDSFQRDPSTERSLTQTNSIRLQPTPALTPAAAESCPGQGVSSSGPGPQRGVECSPAEVDSSLVSGPLKSPVPEPEKGLSRTESMQQLEHWVRSQRSRGPDEDNRSITYQTLPRNMPSHRPQIVPRYPEGYRTLPRNSMARPDSICSAADSVYDHVLRLTSAPGATATEKRRSIRDDTMWQLYEWQQRQAFSRQSLAPPNATSHYGNLPTTKTMGNICDHAVAPSIPTSPSHGSLAHYNTFCGFRQHATHNAADESTPILPREGTLDRLSREGTLDRLSREGTLDRRHRTLLAKCGFPSDRRSIAAAAVAPPTITAQSLQGKTPEELTLLLIKLRRQQAELNNLREHTVTQLMALGLEGPNPKTDVLSHHLQRNLTFFDSQVNTETCKDTITQQLTEESDVDTKLSRLCEQDKVVRLQEEKLQQLHREKHTLETVLLSASQELSQQNGSCTTATQSLVQQREVLQNGLLSTCRELGRVNTELESTWKEYDRLEADVTLAKSNLLEQLEALGSPQTEPPSQRHIQIQKELWRIQDVMEALAKNKLQRHSENDPPASKPLSSLQKNERVPMPPLNPPTEGSVVPPRPPLPQHYDSSVRPPQVTPHHPHHGGRPPHHPPHHATHPDDRATSSRNGVHSQAPDYRLYKSEPELTTVNEEVDEANGEDKDKKETSAETAAPKVPSCPVGIVPPRTKSPLSPPESSTIASYVTLRKVKKPETKSDRPRSAADQLGLVEREVGRTRMSVEEQLERMRRNQEASSLREKRRETLPRSGSFSKDNPFLTLQVLQKETQMQPCSPVTLVLNKHPLETSSTDIQLCEGQRVLILELSSEPRRMEIVNLEPFEDDGSNKQDRTSSQTNTTTENSLQTPENQASSADTKEDTGAELKQDNPREPKLEKNLDSYNPLTPDDHKHNLLASQTFTLVSSDT